MLKLLNCLLFFFNDTATTEIYTLSLHDALPISPLARIDERVVKRDARPRVGRGTAAARRVGSSRCPAKHRHLHRAGDRKSTRLNSSHLVISYAVFCLKKKIRIKCNAWI